jgi:phosphopantothenoylcysteine decarboxylase/phosphopantothenate--cysteine ligase
MSVTRPSPLRVVVTAGPTREPLDDVRYLTNASTGRMGWEIAREAHRRGARVTLLLGPSDLPALPGVETVRFETARELLAAARRAVRGADLVVFAAAPADWRPAVRRRGKWKKDGTGRDVLLRLVENPDVAARLGRDKGRRVHVGFALEVARPFEHARAKLHRKTFDAIVLNGPANVGRGGGPAWWIAPGAEPLPLPARGKAALARAILRGAYACVAAARAAERPPPAPSGAPRSRRVAPPST